MKENIINDGCVLGDKGEFGELFKRDYLTKFLLLTLIVLMLSIMGCNKEPEYIPGQSVQGISAPIAKVLFSPLAFDGARVKVQGQIDGLIVEGNIDDTESPSSAPELQEADPEDLTTLFKLVDTKGNYLNIILPGTWDIKDGDYLIVGGIFRKDGNEIEAYEFEIAEFDEENRAEEIERRDEW